MRIRFNAGDCRTQIMIQSLTTGMDADGFPTEAWTPLWGDGVFIPCKWVNVHGKEVYEAQRLDLREAATLTIRYTPRVNARCRIWRRAELEGLPEYPDRLAYEIISVDDIQDRHELLEIKVQRVVVA